MSPIQKSCWSIAFVMVIVTGAFAEDPVVGKAYQAGTAITGAAVKGNTPASPMSAILASGESAAFKAAAPAEPSEAKRRDGSGSLPSTFTSGDTGVYSSGTGAVPSALKGAEGAGPVGVAEGAAQ